MSVTVPAVWVVLPILLLLGVLLWVIFDWAWECWITPRTDRWIARRYGVSVERVRALREDGEP